MSKANSVQQEAHPELRAMVERMLDSQPFMTFVGAKLGAVSPGRAELHLPYKRELTQHDGFFHGGIIVTLADNAGGAASYTVLPQGMGGLTLEIKVNLLAPGIGEELVARAEVIRPGKRVIVTRSDVYAVRQGKETHCATCLMTLYAAETPSAKAIVEGSSSPKPT
jgi:uncharacterized protein (TIGR00369 family)